MISKSVVSRITFSRSKNPTQSKGDMRMKGQERKVDAGGWRVSLSARQRSFSSADRNVGVRLCRMVDNDEKQQAMVEDSTWARRGTLNRLPHQGEAAERYL